MQNKDNKGLPKPPEKPSPIVVDGFDSNGKRTEFAFDDGTNATPTTRAPDGDFGYVVANDGGEDGAIIFAGVSLDTANELAAKCGDRMNVWIDSNSQSASANIDHINALATKIKDNAPVIVICPKGDFAAKLIVGIEGASVFTIDAKESGGYITTIDNPYELDIPADFAERLRLHSIAPNMRATLARDVEFGINLNKGIIKPKAVKSIDAPFCLFEYTGKDGDKRINPKPQRIRFQHGAMSSILALTGVSKSSLLIWAAWEEARRGGGVALFNPEMLPDRTIARITEIGAGYYLQQAAMSLGWQHHHLHTIIAANKPRDNDPDSVTEKQRAKAYAVIDLAKHLAFNAFNANPKFFVHSASEDRIYSDETEAIISAYAQHFGEPNLVLLDSMSEYGDTKNSDVRERHNRVEAVVSNLRDLANKRGYALVVASQQNRTAYEEGKVHTPGTAAQSNSIEEQSSLTITVGRVKKPKSVEVENDDGEKVKRDLYYAPATPYCAAEVDMCVIKNRDGGIIGKPDSANSFLILQELGLFVNDPVVKDEIRRVYEDEDDGDCLSRVEEEVAKSAKKKPKQSKPEKAAGDGIAAPEVEVESKATRPRPGRNE